MPQLFKKCALVLIILSFYTIGQSQDIHFTNFRMAPVSVNPAFTGAFKGTYRVSAIYRDQWRSIGNSNPYQTPFASVEVNIKGGLLSENDWIAGGLSFVSDQSGSLRFKQQLTGLNVGYHYGLDKDYNNILSVGLTYGSGSQGFNTADIRLPLDLTGGAREIFPEDNNGNVNTSFSDYSLGLSYKSVINNQGDLFRIGVTAAHLTSPNISLVTVQSTPNPNPNPNPTPNPGNNFKVGFDRRITMTGEASFLTTDKLRINPAFIYQAKSSSSEFAIQGIADYLLNQDNGTVVSAGLGYRMGDAIELITGIQVGDLKIGLSYDLTTSSLTNAGGGAFELSVGYIGRIFKTPNVKSVIFCPQL